LRERYEFLLIADDRSEIGWQSDYLPRVTRANLLDVERDFVALCATIDAHAPELGRLAGIFNLSEFAVPLQAKLCAHYGLRGPSEDAALYGRNKAQMRKLLFNLGMPIPRFANVNRDTVHLAEALTFPVIVKPTTGGGSTMVRRCESLTELIAAVEEFEREALRNYGATSLAGDSAPLVVEEVIGGEVLFPTAMPYSVGEISVESVYFDHKTHVLAIHDKPLPANGPHFEEHVFSTPSRIPAELVALAHDYVGRIHRRLGTYVLHTEFRTTQAGLIPLEFGVRMGGACIYNTVLESTGNDFIEIQLDLCQGKTPTIRTGEAKPTIAHCLWAPMTGRIRRITGEQELVSSHFYVDHQLYDGVGSLAKRAPFSSRGSGHVIYRSESFAPLERELADRLARFRIEVDTEGRQI
jgi:biotin carboxylase